MYALLEHGGVFWATAVQASNTRAPTSQAVRRDSFDNIIGSLVV
jgi:hypothetical protein